MVLRLGCGYFSSSCGRELHFHRQRQHGLVMERVVGIVYCLFLSAHFECSLPDESSGSSRNIAVSQHRDHTRSLENQRGVGIDLHTSHRARPNCGGRSLRRRCYILAESAGSYDGLMGPRVTTGALLLATTAAIILVVIEPSEARTLAWRLLPIFVFVAGMSVVVNVCAQVGVFTAVAQALERTAPSAAINRTRFLWAGLILLSIVVTAFLSLDTTAILLTPLAIAVARRNHLNLVAVALSVVWIANLASLHLPVSNLTNLLALSGKGFTSEIDYVSAALVPAIIATTIAVLASIFANRLPQRLARKRSRTVSEISETSSPLLKPVLIILGVLLPALASPIPYWLSSTVAAAAVLAITVWKRREIISLSLIPWSSLILAGALSTVATALNAVGGEDIVRGILGGTQTTPMGLLQLAGAGALTANLINNIPAFLALEPALTTSNGYLAMLIGTNAGSIITPWGSLATLLWHDQLQRAGVQIRWRTFTVLGLILAPLAVILPTLGLLL